jgi:hypothetical protein
MSAGQVLPTTALAGAAYRLEAQTFTVSATQPVDRPVSSMDAGSCVRNLPSPPGIDLTVNYRRELSATFLPSD